MRLASFTRKPYGAFVERLGDFALVNEHKQIAELEPDFRTFLAQTHS